MYAHRIGPLVHPVVLLACLVVVSPVAGGTVAGGAVAGSSVAGDAGQPGDAPDERQDARQLVAGETIEGNLSDGDDADWYAVNATAGDAVVATLALSNTSGNRSIEVNVYDSSGQLATEEERDKMSGPRRVAGKRPGSRQEAIAYAPDVAEDTDTYYVEVKESRWSDTDDGISSPYNLTVTTEELDEHDPNENGATATPIDLATEITAVATPYDHDVYAAELTAGENYTVAFNLTNMPTGRYSKTLTLHTDSSNVTDDDPGYGSWALRMTGNGSGTFTAEETGTHYLRLGQSGITATLLERADYRLTIDRADSSDDSSTDGGDDPPSGDDTPAEEDETPDDDAPMAPDEDAETAPDDGATPLPNDAAAVDDGTDDGAPAPSGTATTTDTGTWTLVDGGDATSTDGGTDTFRGGGGGSNEVTATPSPVGDGGPGFGVVVALVSLLAVARIASRRSRR